MPGESFPIILQSGAFGLVALAFVYGIKALDRLITAAVQSMSSMASTISEVKTELIELRGEIRRKLPTLPERD